MVFISIGILTEYLLFTLGMIYLAVQKVKGVLRKEKRVAFIFYKKKHPRKSKDLEIFDDSVSVPMNQGAGSNDREDGQDLEDSLEFVDIDNSKEIKLEKSKRRKIEKSRKSQMNKSAQVDEPQGPKDSSHESRFFDTRKVFKKKSKAAKKEPQKEIQNFGGSKEKGGKRCKRPELGCHKSSIKDAKKKKKKRRRREKKADRGVEEKKKNIDLNFL